MNSIDHVQPAKENNAFSSAALHKLNAEVHNERQLNHPKNLQQKTEQNGGNGDHDHASFKSAQTKDPKGDTPFVHHAKGDTAPHHHSKSDSQQENPTEKKQGQKKDETPAEKLAHFNKLERDTMGKMLGEMENTIKKGGPHMAQDLSKMWENWKKGCNGKGGVSDDMEAMKAYIAEANKRPGDVCSLTMQDKGKEWGEFVDLIGKVITHADKLAPEMIKNLVNMSIKVLQNPEKSMIDFAGMIPKLTEEGLKAVATDGLTGKLPEGPLRDFIEFINKLDDKRETTTKIAKAIESPPPHHPGSRDHRSEPSTEQSEGKSEHHQRPKSPGTSHHTEKLTAYMLPSHHALPFLEIVDSDKVLAS